jgi:hypothetical protein
MQQWTWRVMASSMTFGVSSDSHSNGLAIMLTNNPALWQPATVTARDSAFRIHEGRTITGDLAWGTPEAPYQQNDSMIRGRYTARWYDFSNLEGCQLRWLAWTIDPPGR